MGRTRLSDSVEFLGALQLRRCVSQLLQVSERRVNHSRTRRVDATGVLFNGFDDFVAVARLFAEQSKDDEPEITRRKHLCCSHSRAHEAPAHTVKWSSSSPKSPKATVTAAFFENGKFLMMSMHIDSF